MFTLNTCTISWPVFSLEIKETANGTKLAKFSIPTKDRIKRWEEWEDETDWHNCIAWWYLAERMEKFVNEKDKVVVTGMMKVKKFEKEDGTKWVSHVIRCSDIILPAYKKREDLAQAADETFWEEPVKQRPKYPQDDIAISDIPF